MHRGTYADDGAAGGCEACNCKASLGAMSSAYLFKHNVSINIEHTSVSIKPKNRDHRSDRRTDGGATASEDEEHPHESSRTHRGRCNWFISALI